MTDILSGGRSTTPSAASGDVEIDVDAVSCWRGNSYAAKANRVGVRQVP